MPIVVLRWPEVQAMSCSIFQNIYAKQVFEKFDFGFFFFSLTQKRLTDNRKRLKSSPSDYMLAFSIHGKIFKI